MTRVRVGRSGSVCCRAALHLPLSARAAWGRLRTSPASPRRTTSTPTSSGRRRPRRGAAPEHPPPLPRASRVDPVGRDPPLADADQPSLRRLHRSAAGYSFSDLSPAAPATASRTRLRLFLRAGAAGPTKPLPAPIVVRGRWTCRTFPGGRPGCGSGGCSATSSCPSATRSCWPSQRDATPTLCLEQPASRFLES